MSAGTEPPLVGRQQELEALARLLDDLVDAPSALVLQVAGEPGIGKRGLLRELRTVAGDQGHLVLSGRAVEFEAELPFGVFGDALDDWLTDLPAERLAALAGPRATDLAGVPPAFEALAGGEAPQLEQERYRGVPPSGRCSRPSPSTPSWCWRSTMSPGSSPARSSSSATSWPTLPLARSFWRWASGRTRFRRC